MTGANFVFVAPTGAGKTKIFVEASRYFFLDKSVNQKGCCFVFHQSPGLDVLYFHLLSGYSILDQEDFLFQISDLQK